jgi:predicted metal-dependent peptidase
MAAVLSARDTLARIQKGLRLVTVPFPHLSGLVAAARVSIDERVPTVGVFASGRMVANPAFVAKLKDNELVFVLAHEMLHLALRTHDRARGSDPMQFNYAHDYIINDLLRVELGFQQIPAGGLDMPGAREKSAEQIHVEMRKNAAQMPSKTRVFDGEATTVRRLFQPGERGAGQPQTQAQPGDAGDVLGSELEKQLFPNEAGDPAEQQRRAEAVKALAAKALSLAKAMGAMKGMRGLGGGGETQTVDALRGLYRTPWEAALQRWLESVAPGERTFTRPSRRGAACTDGVLPGRRREGWMLNIVLDTSGSMSSEISRALGAIAHFCDAVAVDQVRLVQCDTAVTADECLDPAQLNTFEVSGYGGSDLTPAMVHLAADPAVRAVMVITDGDIEYAREAPPYHVLWVLPPGAGMGFSPPYGHVVWMSS